MKWQMAGTFMPIMNHYGHRKFSIRSGFINDISPQIIGNCCNLELLPAINNISKGAKCSLTLDELFTLYYEQIQSRSIYSQKPTESDW